jgi:hypothetical protein
VSETNRRRDDKKPTNRSGGEMNEQHTLIAFLCVLGAIVLLFMIASTLLYFGRSVEAIGIGGVMTGLIGILGTFKPRTTTPDSPQPVNIVNPPGDPVNVEDSAATDRAEGRP